MTFVGGLNEYGAKVCPLCEFFIEHALFHDVTCPNNANQLIDKASSYVKSLEGWIV
jgi:hypothetical protein